MAYGRSLDLDAKWALAADVYETVIAHVHPLEESDVAISAHLRRAYCQRSLGALEDASTSYDAASSIAGSIGDIFGMLRAQIGSATIAKTRGNIPEAEALLDDAIARAESHELTDVRALALQDRADIAYLRGNYDLAVRVAYEALEHTKDPVNRDRILSDIATSFYMLGVRSVARDTYLIIEATAQEQYARWVASINLMEIAAQDGSMPLFERYRKLLSSADLPPLLRAQFLLHLGEGYAALGETSLAEAALTTASDLAGKYALNQLSFTIEESIRRVVDMANNPTQPETDVPPSLVGIARDLGALRRQLAKPL
jgi:tetratricopeptide (TPR) repeat protein